MNTDVRSIVARLRALTQNIQQYALLHADLTQERFAQSSAKLVASEQQRLERAVSSGRDVDTAWALRSVADMIKGLIDIGSDIDQRAPALWAEASSIAGDAYRVEVNMREP